MLYTAYSVYLEKLHNYGRMTQLLLIVNPLNAHAAKAKLTWQRVSCKQNQSDKILSMTGEADSKFVVRSTHNHWL